MSGYHFGGAKAQQLATLMAAKREELRERGLIPAQRVFIHQVQLAVATETGILPAVQIGARQAPDITLARQIAIVLSVELTGQSVKAVAERFNRHPATVKHTLERIKQLLASGEKPELAQLIKRCRGRAIAEAGILRTDSSAEIAC